MEKNQVISNLVKNGGVVLKDLKVKNVNVTVKENYTRVALTLDKEVDGYTSEDGVTFEKGKTNVIFLSLFSISSILKDNEDTAFAASYAVEHINTVKVLLSGANISIIQESVAEGQEYINPWSDNAEPTVFDHATIINHLTDIKLGKFGEKALEAIFNKMLDSTI